MYEIRRATVEDIVKSEKELFDIFIQIENYGEKNKKYYTNRISQLKLFLKDGSAILFCAFDNKKIIGFNWGYIRNFNGDKRVSIHYIGVDKLYRNKGIGKKLIKEMEFYAAQKQIKKIDLYVNPDNENAILMYKKNNFKEEKILMLKEI